MHLSELKALVSKAVQSIGGSEGQEINLETPSEDHFGDLSTNIALVLSKDMQMNPRELAEKILKALPRNSIIQKTEIAGPGFINIWLQDEVFQNAFEKLIQKVKEGSFGHLEIGKGIKAITDSSHPNIAKPMGVHHLLSTILGQAINNLFLSCGYELIRDNYYGDWGTQFGKLIYAIRSWGDMEDIKKDPIPELLKLYVTFHEEVEKNEALEEEGRKEFKKLEDGDEENRKLWKWICELSLQEFQKLWDRLGVHFDMMHSESYYEDKMPTILQMGLEKEVIQEGERGSLIIPMDDENMPPCILQKSDGATTYATRDLARINDWQDVQKAQLGVVIVDIAQKLHFEQVHESAHKLGINKINHQAIHFGRMSFPDGSMSTRKGKVVLLEDVLDEAEKRAYEKIESHNSELPADEKKELARKMGIGAIKYNVLSQNRNKNYTFDWDVMLSFEGNSAPYLQYAYTRTQSLLRKANHEGEDDFVEARLIAPLQNHPHLQAEEKSLIKKLLEFEPTIQRSLDEFKPNLLSTYLFELAQDFSTFYNNLRILDAETDQQKTVRLQFVTAVAYTLKKGLAMLGIEVPERM